MIVKNKYYIFFNVLKFEEYIVYIKVQIWIWWKCWIIYHQILQYFCFILWTC